jgi:hypothetical protein
MAIAENPQFHKQTKHFGVKVHYIREKINENTIKVEYCPTLEMVAHIMTKPLAHTWYVQHSESLGMTLA